MIAPLMVGAFLAVLGLILTARRGLTDVVTLSVLVFMLFYGVRALILALGLDSAFPEYLFGVSDVDALVTKATAVAALFSVMLALGLQIARTVPVKRAGPLFLEQEPKIGRMFGIAAALTLISIVISAWLFAAHGGFEGVVLAAKVEKGLAGSYVLQVPSLVGSIVAAACWLDMKRAHAPSSGTLLALLMAFANAGAVFAWGQRSALVVVLAMLIVGRAAAKGGRASRTRAIGSVAVAAILVISLASGLRVFRDTIIQGDVSDEYAEGNVFRKISLGLNANYFDASLLAVRDWPSRFEYRNGEDFVVGVQGVVPRAVWEEKPTSINPGRWFRQVYQPEVINGWPLGAPTTWYINFGLLGVLLGGLLSGYALGMLSSAQAAASQSGFNTGVAMVLAVFVFQLGWPSDLPLRVVTWLGPLFLVGVALRSRSSTSSRRPGRVVRKARSV